MLISSISQPGFIIPALEEWQSTLVPFNECLDEWESLSVPAVLGADITASSEGRDDGVKRAR